MIGRVVVTWEKLRIPYNVTLLLVTLETAAAAFLKGTRSPPDTIGIAILGCIVANAAFMLGPLIDGYLSWLGLRHAGITALLFLIGTLIASVLAAGVMLLSKS
jgi:hypothetical protein